MSAFEDKIKREKKFFNYREPLVGHQERFLDKLNDLPASKVRKVSFSLLLKTAAVLLIFITAGSAMFYFLTERQNSDSYVNKMEYDKELTAVFAYYDEESASKLKQIDQLTSNSEESKKLKMSAQKQLENIDISLAKIEKEYSKNPENENVKAALINNKRKKVEVMDQILMQIDFASSGIY